MDRSKICLVALALVAGVITACNGTNTTTATGPDGDVVVTVTMTDNAFEPDSFEVAAGETVTFRFVNDGRAVHEAVLGDGAVQRHHAEEMMDSRRHGGGHMPGPHMDTAAVVVDPGATGDLTFTFEGPETLLIGCHQPGHWEAGMVAEVRVA